MDIFIAQLKTALMGAALLAFMFGLILLTVLPYKLKANRLGVKVSWKQLLVQKIRNTLTQDILDAAGLAVKEGLDISIRQLETHRMSGGNPSKVVKGMADSRKTGFKISFNQAVALDLIGREISKEEIDKVYG